MNDKEKQVLQDNIIKETPLDFAKKIEDLVWMKDISYLDALLEIVTNEGYEVETVPKLLTKEILLKLKDEASDRKLLKVIEPKQTVVSFTKFLKQY